MPSFACDQEPAFHKFDPMHLIIGEGELKVGVAGKQVLVRSHLLAADS